MFFPLCFSVSSVVIKTMPGILIMEANGMGLKTTRWDSAEFLRTDEDIVAYFDAVLEEGDPALVLHALGVIARAKGMNRIAQEAGIGSDALAKALTAGGNPEFVMVFNIMKSLGLKLQAMQA